MHKHSFAHMVTPLLQCDFVALILISNYSDFPSRILAAGGVVAVCLLCVSLFMFLQVLQTILRMAAVCLPFSVDVAVGYLVFWLLRQEC